MRRRGAWPDLKPGPWRLAAADVVTGDAVTGDVVRRAGGCGSRDRRCRAETAGGGWRDGDWRGYGFIGGGEAAREPESGCEDAVGGRPKSWGLRRARDDGLGGGGGKLAGLPEGHQVVEPHDQADQARHDEGVQHRHDACLGGELGRLGAHVGQEAGKRRGRGKVVCCFHVRDYT